VCAANVIIIILVEGCSLHAAEWFLRQDSI